jgi:hypothetical protein
LRRLSEEDFDHDAMRCPVCWSVYPLPRVLDLLDQALRGLSDLQLTLAQEHILFCANQTYGDPQKGA